MSTHAARPARRVLMLVFDGVRLLDVTGPVEVFTTANDFGGRYEIVLASPSGADVVTATGTRLGVDAAAAETQGRFDIFIVPGGPNWPTMTADHDFLNWLRTLSQRSDHIASVCTGSLILAAAGLLAGHRATTHWRYSADLARLFPSVAVHPDAIFVRDGAVVTSAGVSAGIDLSLAFVEDHFGAAVAREVAKDLVVFLQRPGGQSQFSARTRAGDVRQEALRRILDSVVADPAADHSLASMARRGGVSVRHLTRLFDHAIGTTPSRYVEQVRLEAAAGMLEASDRSVDVVARDSGFGSQETLRRAFSRHLGITPGAYRARFRTTGTSFAPGIESAGRAAPTGVA